MATRFLAITAATVLTLSACGGGGETEQQAASPPAAAPQQQAPAQTMASLPEGVTQAMVDEGKTLFGGAGICYTCHGQTGGGVQGLGPNLGDAEWLHSDGAYEAIVNQINQGVTAAESKTGTVMPPKGGAVNLTDAQVRAIAAYVYSLRGM